MTCNKCGVELVSGGNWKPYYERVGNYQCWDCVKAYNRVYLARYRKTPKGKRNAKRSAATRTAQYVGQRIDGKRVMVRAKGKRSRTEVCEICQEPKPRLVYHHWNDEDFSQGLWVCQGCHNVAHAWEDKQPQMLRYRALKDMASASLVGMTTK